MPPPPMGQEAKEEGPAEAAPEEEGRPSDLEPLGGYAEQARKKMQIFELDGYLRLRSDYLHNFNLGQNYSTLSFAPVGSNRQFLQSTGYRHFRCRSGARARRGRAGRRMRNQGTGRREPAPAPRADLQRDRPGAGSRPDRRPRQHHHGIDARLPGRDVRDPQDALVGRRAVAAALHHAGPARGRAERLPVQHPRQARVGRGRQRVRIAAVRPHALALRPRHRLQRWQLPRLRAAGRPSTA